MSVNFNGKYHFLSSILLFKPRCIIIYLVFGGDKMIKYLVEFVIVFIVLFLFNYFVINIKERKKKRVGKKEVSSSLYYLVLIYGIDINKVNYHQFIIISSLVNSLIISSVYMVLTYLVQNLILKIVLGIILLGLMIIICYGILGNYYLKKESK